MSGNQLFYGDNLDVLRNDIQSESIDLVYLDPPFNSKATYNLLFKSPKGQVRAGQTSAAQIEAFEDTWHWNEYAEREFNEVLHQPNTDAAEMIKALRSFLGENDMMAYLTMMANRLLELRRVLKPTASIYLHCDPTASHYLKILMDAVFDVRNYRNEITWKRRVGMSSAVHESNRFGICTDILLFYAKSEEALFFPQYNKDTPEYQQYIAERFTMVDEKGRLFQATSLVNPAPRPNLTYEYKGYQPPPNGWMISREKMEQWDREDRIYFPKEKTGRLRRKSYVDELRGMPVQNLWTDISEINSQAAERLGYPTQKPEALLERIIKASSQVGDMVLDPFCGCGTAVHAAQHLKRRWIGIDITCLAIGLVERRLKDAFGKDCAFEVHGTPKDLESARDLAVRDKYQFQWWAVTLIDAQPYQGKKKGADTGIDGLKFFHDLDDEARKIIVSVKGGEHLKADDVRALNHVRAREKAEIAVLISLAKPTAKMRADAASAGFYADRAGRQHARIQMLTVDGLLSGLERAEHPDYIPHANYKKAKREKTVVQPEMFDDPGVPAA